MKTYRTWEAIKMLTENRNLKFKNVNKALKGEILKRVYDVAQVNDCSENKILLIYLTSNWELIQEPVTFMEAIKAYCEGKTICVIYESIKTYYHPTRDAKHDGFHNSVLAIEILEGKWFIGEDNINE